MAAAPAPAPSPAQRVVRVSFGCGGPVTFDFDWAGWSSAMSFAVTGAASASASGGISDGMATASSTATEGSMVVQLSCDSGSSAAYTFTIDWD